MADQGRSELLSSFYHEPLTLELKELLISLLFRSYGFDIRRACFEKLFEASLWI